MADLNSERRELRAAGARPHPNSGRGHVKGDGSDDMFVIDVKEAAVSFALNSKRWGKAKLDAYVVDKTKHPQLLVVLGTGKKVRLAIIESAVLQELQEENKCLKQQLNQLKKSTD
jgi:hypothetical protein